MEYNQYTSKRGTNKHLISQAGLLYPAGKCVHMLQNACSTHWMYSNIPVKPAPALQCRSHQPLSHLQDLQQLRCCVATSKRTAHCTRRLQSPGKRTGSQQEAWWWGCARAPAGLAAWPTVGGLGCAETDSSPSRDFILPGSTCRSDWKQPQPP